MSTDHVGESASRDNKSGCFVFVDHKDFRPNLSPQEVLAFGSFGGTYFRDIELKQTEKWYKNAWKEFESDGWFDGLDIKRIVCSNVYRKEVNFYKVKCGQSLDVWESKGWIKPEYDSHGWFHWYCRFFKGRRCPDDDRQIGRWRAIAGVNGRWRNNLIAKCVRAGKKWDDLSLSPVVRQTLQHWAYRLTEEDFELYAKKVRKGARTSFIRQSTMKHVVENSEEDREVDALLQTSRKRPLEAISSSDKDYDSIVARVKRKRS